MKDLNQAKLTIIWAKWLDLKFKKKKRKMIHKWEMIIKILTIINNQLPHCSERELIKIG